MAMAAGVAKAAKAAMVVAKVVVVVDVKAMIVKAAML